MHRTHSHILHHLLLAIVVVTAVGPATPARAAVPSAHETPLASPGVRGRADRRGAGLGKGLAAGGESMDARSEQTAPTDPVAVDPGAWVQDAPSGISDSAGNTYVVWEDYRDGSPHVRFAQRPPGGAWQPSVKVDPTASGDQKAPQVAVDGAGNLFAAWEDYRGAVPRIYFSYRSAGGDWGVSQPVSVTAEAQDRPSLAANRRGEAAVTWRQGDWPVYDVYCAIRPASGDWGSAQRRTASGGNVVTADVALDDWGRVYVTWDDWDQNQILFAERSPAGSWSGAQPIRGSTVGWSWGTQIAVDRAGNAQAVWEDGRAGSSQIYAAYRPCGGPWSLNVRIDGGEGEMWSPGLGIDGAGNAVAGWSRENEDIYVAVRYHGSAWISSQLLLAAPTSTANASKDAHTAPVVDPQAIQSWGVTLAVAGSAPSLMLVGASAFGAANVLQQALTPPGSNGCTNVAVAAAAVTQASRPQGATEFGANACRAGNGGQEPALNADEGAFPQVPSTGEGAAAFVRPVETDGRTVFVVPVPGKFGMFDSREAAEAYASQHHALLMPPPPVTSLEAGIGIPAEAVDAPEEMPAEVERMAQQLEQRVTPQEMTPEEIAALEAERTHDPFTGRMLREIQDRIEAQRLMERSVNEPLSPEDQRRLADVTRGAFGGKSPAEVRAVFMAAREFGMVYPEVTAYMVGEMSPEGFEWLKQKVLRERARREAERAAQAAAATRVPRNVTPTPSRRREKPLEQLMNYYDRIRQLSQGTDPVLLHSGEFVHQETPLSIPGRGMDYALHLSYHAQLIYNGPVGWGWEHSYERSVAGLAGGSVALREGGGRFDVYIFDGASYTPPAGRYTNLVSTTAGVTITDRCGLAQAFYPLGDAIAPGSIKALVDRHGNALRFDYDSQGRLETVIDTLDRAITYSYDSNDRVSQVTDFAGRTVTLAYDSEGNLVSITTPVVTGTPNGNDFPLGKTTVFSYTSGFEDQRLNHNLIAILAPNEVADGSMTPRTINTYGTEGFAFDRVVRQSWGGGRANGSGVPAGGEVTLVYTTTIDSDAPTGAASKTILTDRIGNVTELWHDGAGHRLRQKQIVEGEVLATDRTYNADGQVASVNYPAANRTEYTYDDGAADRFAQGNLLEMRRVADAGRGCDGAGATPCPDLVTSFTYEPVFQQLQGVTDARDNTVTRTYDAEGNLLQETYPDVNVGPAAPQSASVSWTYNAWGQRVSFTDAEGNVTCYEYYGSGPARGYLQRETRGCGGPSVSSEQAPLASSGQGGGSTTEYGYDALGNLTVVTDALGIRSEYAVNALGQIVKETQAAGTPLDYETLAWYDANDNLVRVDVENVILDLDGDFHPTGTHSRQSANPWLTTEYTYDLLDNVVRVVSEVTASSHVSTEQRYDPMGRLASVTDAEGHRTTYSYDDRGLAREVTQGAGSTVAATTTYEYDANGSLVRSTDGEGHPTDLFYDGFDRQVGRVDATGNVRFWRYDSNGNVVRSGLRDGQDGRNPDRTITATTPVTLTHTVFHFDERDRRWLEERMFFSADLGSGTVTPLTMEADGDGWAVRTTSYDRNGNATAVADDNGNTTTYAYDALGRLVLTTDALSNTIEYVYDGNDNLIQTVESERQPDGMVPSETFTTTSSFDAVNRLIATVDSLGQASRYAYDSRGNLVFYSDANGPAAGDWRARAGGLTTEVVTTNGGRSEVVSTDGGTTEVVATDGGTTEVVATDGGTAEVVATNGGTAEVVTTNGGRTEVVTTVQQNGHGNTAGFVYDGLSRLVEETHHLRAGGVGSGAVVGEVALGYAYDGNGNLTRRTDPTGNETRYAYDGLDRTRVITYADGTTEWVAYDRAHNLVEQIDANGSVVTHSYDALNRLVRSDVARAPGVVGTTLQTFAWDGLSRMVGARDNNDPADPSDDSVIAFSYDSLSNRTIEVQDGHTGTSTHDGVGNRLSLTYPGGRVVTATYDALDRVSAITADGDELARYDYIGSGRPLRRVNGNGIYAAYTYDGAKRLTGIAYRQTSDDALLSAFSTTYDRVGNRTSETSQPAGDTVTYTYDSLYRLIGAHSSGCEIDYAYDAVGNRTQVTRDSVSTSYTANQVNEYESVDGETRTHDANGNLLTRRLVEACVALTSVKVAGPAAGYTGASIVLTSAISPSDATEPVNYTWSPEPEGGQGTAGTTYSWAAPGLYTVTLTARNCGGAVSDTYTITVESPPCPRPLEGVEVGGPTEGYTDASIVFSSAITPSDATQPITYTWSPDPVTGQGTTSASYAWASPGVYTVTLEVENCGGVVSDTHAISIDSPPPACPSPLEAVAIEGPTQGHSGVVYGFTAIITPSDATEPITYTWFPGPVSGQGTTGVSYTWAMPGVYTVTVGAENCGGVVSDSHPITISTDDHYGVYLPLVPRSHGGMALTYYVADDMPEPQVTGANVFTETVVRYAYDFADRLVEVTEWVTVTNDSETVVIGDAVRYTYDALGRQVTRRSGGATVRTVYAGGRVIEERDGGGVLLGTYVGALTMERGGKQYFYQVDGLGSVRALAGEGGDIDEWLWYDPFGSPSGSNGSAESALGNPYLFRGLRYDADVGLYLQGSRRYEPTTGRHLQRGAEALGNAYTFAANNPLGGEVR